MMSKENQLTDEQLIQVAGGKGYERDDEVVLNGLNITTSMGELDDLAARDPSQLTAYEKTILDYARNINII